MLQKFEILTNAFQCLQNEVANNSKCITNMQEHVVSTQASVTSEHSRDNNGASHRNAWDLQNLQRSSVQSEKKQSALRDVNNDNRSNNNVRPAKKKIKQPSLIVKCDEEGVSPDLSQIRTVAVTNGVTVSQVYVTSNNNAVVTLPNVDALNKFKPLLSTTPLLNKHEVDNVRHKSPRISILDVDELYGEMGSVDTIKLQNPDVATLLNNRENFLGYFHKKGKCEAKIPSSCY